MDTFEANTQSFIVKIWVEEPAHGEKPAVWRGHITHVVTGQRLHFDDIEEMKSFVTQYLAGGDSQPGSDSSGEGE